MEFVKSRDCEKQGSWLSRPMTLLHSLFDSFAAKPLLEAENRQQDDNHSQLKP
jgi:hypothetical protein